MPTTNRNEEIINLDQNNNSTGNTRLRSRVRSGRFEIIWLRVFWQNVIFYWGSTDIFVYEIFHTIFLGEIKFFGVNKLTLV